MTTHPATRDTGENGVSHSHLTRFPGGEFCTNCGYVAPEPPVAGDDVPSLPWWCTGLTATKPDLSTIALVLRWMIAQDYKTQELLYLVEKPWKFYAEFAQAVQDCAPLGTTCTPAPPQPEKALLDIEQQPDLLDALQRSLQRHRALRSVD